MHTYFALDPATLLVFVKLSVAMLCGVVLGTERTISHKAAGMRTYALVAMGAALFIIIGQSILASFGAPTASAITAVMQGIITGVGFMGAGVIIFHDTNVIGLTSASGLWVASGVGIACDYGLFMPAIMATFLTLFVFVVLWRVERLVKKAAPQETIVK